VTEAQLIQKARAGDGDAWEALTRQHQEHIFRLAYLLLGDPDEAQDITQETFVRAFYRLRRFEEGRPLRPWLLRIASRLCNNRRRSVARYLAALGRLALEPAPDTGQGSEAADAAELWAAVRRLGPDFQEVIYLRYFLELREDEAAAAIGVPPGTVKSRLHRGLQQLRRVISREFPGLEDSFSP
jgi:RNA polymerase sigma-70 factor (ECF subfamily)